jgi:hypothetical protein
LKKFIILKLLWWPSLQKYNQEDGLGIKKNLRAFFLNSFVSSAFLTNLTFWSRTSELTFYLPIIYVLFPWELNAIITIWIF